MKWIIAILIFCFITLRAQEPITSFMGIEFGTTRLEAMKVIKEKYNAEYQRTNKGVYYFDVPNNKDHITQIEMRGQQGLYYGSRIIHEVPDVEQGKEKLTTLIREWDEEYGTPDYYKQDDFKTGYLWIGVDISTLAILEGEEYPEYYLIQQSVFKIMEDEKEEIEIMLIKDGWEEVIND